MNLLTRGALLLRVPVVRVWVFKVFGSVGIGCSNKAALCLTNLSHKRQLVNVTQSQRSAPHQVDTVYRHIVTPTLMRDTYTSPSARGTLLWLHQSHTRSHTLLLIECEAGLENKMVVVGGREGLLIRSSPPSLDRSGLTARLKSVTSFVACLAEMLQSRCRSREGTGWRGHKPIPVDRNHVVVVFFCVADHVVTTVLY